MDSVAWFHWPLVHSLDIMSGSEIHPPFHNEETWGKHGKTINSSISYEAKWSRKNGYVKDLKHLETTHFVASLLVETGPCLGNIH